MLGYLVQRVGGIPKWDSLRHLSLHPGKCHFSHVKFPVPRVSSGFKTWTSQRTNMDPPTRGWFGPCCFARDHFSQLSTLEGSIGSHTAGAGPTLIARSGCFASKKGKPPKLASQQAKRASGLVFLTYVWHEAGLSLVQLLYAASGICIPCRLVYCFYLAPPSLSTIYPRTSMLRLLEGQSARMRRSRFRQAFLYLDLQKQVVSGLQAALAALFAS